MSTIKSASSPGASTVNSTGDLRQSWKEYEGISDDSSDPDRLLQCPYDKNHQIRACRFPYHIIKCRKNHPKLASQLKTCPFNAKHLMPKHELSHHIENCEDRPRCVSPEDEQNKAAMLRKFQVPISTWRQPVSEEDWDEEADDQAGTFVWGVSSNQLVQNKPVPSTTNHLPPGIRAPQTLPWKLCES